jgi:hypothetical protein
MQIDIFYDSYYGVSSVDPICLVVGFNTMKKIHGPKILFISNMRLFFNTLPCMQVSIFPGPYHRVSSVDPIYLVVGFDIIKKFMGPRSCPHAI